MLYESSACSIIFYNVFSDNVNNLYESILLISSFLFFFVGKVLVANEKSRRNNITDDVNIFVESVPNTTEKFSHEVLVSHCCVPWLALISQWLDHSIFSLGIPFQRESSLSLLIVMSSQNLLIL